jgi:hypothetical protein
MGQVILCLNHEYFNYVLQKYHQNRTRIDFGIMFWKIAVLYEIYSKKLVLCLTRELMKFIDYKIMLKLQCKTTFYSTFVGKKKSSKSNKSRLWNIFFFKCGFIWNITVTEYFLHVSVYNVRDINLAKIWTYVLASVGKNIIKIEQEFALE